MTLNFYNHRIIQFDNIRGLADPVLQGIRALREAKDVQKIPTRVTVKTRRKAVT